MNKPIAILLAVPCVGYAAWSAARNDLRVEHILLAFAATGLALAHPRTRELLGALYPFAIVGILFDAMRAYKDVGLDASRIMLCDLRAFESRLFGWESNGERFTVHDFFLTHHHLVLDVFCAIPYATFILWCIVGSIYFYAKDRLALRRFGCSFLLVNVAGFVTYHVLPAAPPWYFHEHGCVVDVATAATEGPALMRVDAALGIGYFHGMYGKASSVFGALPSLHCAYPLLLAIAGWRTFGPRLRAFAVFFWVWMLFASVYLDHHWLVDGLLGSIYAVAAYVIVRLIEVAWSRRRHPNIVTLSPTVREPTP